MKGQDPQTPAEWQEAVDGAEFYLLVHSAMLYGLVTGPKVNADRCDEILRRGKKLGFYPASHDDLAKRYLKST